MDFENQSHYPYKKQFFSCSQFKVSCDRIISKKSTAWLPGIYKEEKSYEFSKTARVQPIRPEINANNVLPLAEGRVPQAPVKLLLDVLCGILEYLKGIFVFFTILVLLKESGSTKEKRTKSCSDLNIGGVRYLKTITQL